MTTIVKNLHVGKENFAIVKNEEGFYLSINRKFIDSSGRVTRQLNGIEIHASKDVNKCINDTITSVKIRELVEAGYSIEDAIHLYFNLK